MKKIVKIATADVSVESVMHLLQYVSDKYEFEITHDLGADYVFHSVGGYDVLKYAGVRIFFTGENVTPNFAVSDYAMAFDKLTFNDRYIWLPLIKLFREEYEALRSPRPPVVDVVRRKTGFCAYVMSNTKNSASERERIFDLLSSYKQVDSGGSWRNNVGGRVSDKLGFQSKYKFVIAFENSSTPGYLTEKFSQAAAANAVPIYWGDPEIGELFNNKAFINCHDYQTLEEVVEQVRLVDENEGLYRQMLAEPWFPAGREPEELQDVAYAKFLSNIFEQEPLDAYRRNRSRWGLKFEKNLYDMYHRPYIHSGKLLRSIWRKTCRSFLPRRKKY